MFISNQTIVNVISQLTNENLPQYVRVIKQFKQKIISNNYGVSLITKITESLNQERVKQSTYRDEKVALLNGVTEILNHYKNELESIDSTYFDKLFVEIFEGYKQVDLSKRILFIIPMKQLQPLVSPSYQSQITTEANNFIVHVEPELLAQFFKHSTVIDNLDDLMTNSLAQLIPVIRTDTNRRDVVYEHAPDDIKQKIINDLILHTADKGLSFMNNKDIPDKATTIKLMLEELKKLQPPQSRIGGYNWVVASLSPKDDASLKDEFAKQILEILKLDNNDQAKIGYDFYIQAKVLGVSRRRDIANELLRWIQHEKDTISQNLYAIKAIMYAIKDLDLGNTPRQNLEYVLFQRIRSNQDRQTLEVALESIIELNPKHSQNKQSYTDIIEALKGWANNNDKKYVVEGLLSLKSDKISKNSKEYWEELEEMQKQLAGI